jgi:hypothetical protein
VRSVERWECGSKAYLQTSENWESSESVCDGLDNDCDGETDNGLTAPACTNQKGVCQNSVSVCGGSCGTCGAGTLCSGGLCAASTCGADPNLTCQGRCGNYDPAETCQCDSLCAGEGDCCADLGDCCP